MNISGIRPSVGFYDTNSIKFKTDLEATPVEEASVEVSVDLSKDSPSEEEILEARKSQTFGAYDFASQYKPDEVYDLKGADSDIKSLDVERAVSDMQKDSVIHRYQYFVQNKNGGAGATPKKGTEDFTL